MVVAAAYRGAVGPGVDRWRVSTDHHTPTNSRPSETELVSKRTYQPNNRRRHKTNGFRLRMRTRAGRAILNARRRKGRDRLAV